MGQRNVTDGDVTELVRSVAEATSAYIRGDIQRYLTLIKHGDNYTLMAPYGGEPRRGFDVKEALETTPRMFRGGEADLELAETYASGDPGGRTGLTGHRALSRATTTMWHCRGPDHDDVTSPWLIR